MKTTTRGYAYIGKVTPGDMNWTVEVENPHGIKDLLLPRNDVRNHSPDGFTWGYGGSGPAQLALAMLLHYFEIVAGMRPQAARVMAERYYQDFKFGTIARLDKDTDFRIEAQQIADAIAALAHKKSAAAMEVSARG